MRSLRRILLLAVTLAAAVPATAPAAPGQLTTLAIHLPQVDGITAGTDGTMWVTDSENIRSSNIVSIAPDGHTTVFRGGTGVEILDLTLGPDQDIWFDDLNAAIGTLTPSGTLTEFRTGLMSNSLIGGIVTGPDHNLWFSDDAPDPSAMRSDPAIGRITPAGQITEYRDGILKTAIPTSLVAGSDGNVWFVDKGDPGAIGRITPAGQISEFFGPSEEDAPLVGGIAPGADGNVWFSDFEPASPAVARITPDGHITRFTRGLLGARTSSPDAMTLGPDGNVYFVDNNIWGRAIGQVTLAGTITEAPISPPGDTTDFIQGIAPGPGGIWMINGDAIRRMSIGGPLPGGAGRPLRVRLSCTHHGSAKADWVCASTLVAAAGRPAGPVAVTARQISVIASGAGRLAGGRLTATLTLRGAIEQEFDFALAITHGHSRRVVYARLTSQGHPESSRPPPKRKKPARR